MKNIQKEAFKEATSLYSEERSKEGGKSAQVVCDTVNDKCGATVEKRMVQKHVKEQQERDDMAQEVINLERQIKK